MKHSIKDWLTVTRFWSFSVSAMPVIVTVAYLFWRDNEINWLCVFIALVGNVLFHAAGNVLSDWWDYRKGIDNERAYAVPQLVFHQFKPEEYLRFSLILFAVSICIGIILTLMTGWELLVIGGIGAILAASYSFFKFRAMGDIFVFVCFAVLPVVGTSFVATGSIDWTSLIASLPLGIFTIGVLHDNNTVDISTDSQAGIKTLPMFFGERASVKIFIVYMILPFIAVLGSCIARFLPYTALLCLIAVPVSFYNIKIASAYFTKGREAMIGLDEKTAKLHLIFSMLLTAGIMTSTIF